MKLAGTNGFLYARYSSMDNRAVGKFTDSNHLYSLATEEPADYDRKIISLYSQTQLYSNDFLDMINKSEPYYIDTNSDSWKWKLSVPKKFARIVAIPDSTKNNPQVGIDGQEFSLVIDSNEFSENSRVVLGHQMYGPQLYAISDPQPWGLNGYIQKFTLIAQNPSTEFVSQVFLREGIEVLPLDNIIGEFDQKLGGLPRLGQYIELYESLSSGYGFEHTITKWADERTLRDPRSGKPLDILVYANSKNIRGEMSDLKSVIRWEPVVEYLLRVEMLRAKVNRMIWGKPGIVRSSGHRQEEKKVSTGIYHRLKQGNYVSYNRGEFSAQLLRTLFGDIFYRRVSMKERRVKIYTNEAGFDVAEAAFKKDAMGSGLNFFTNVDALSASKVTATSPQNRLVYGFALGGMYSRETGLVELVHLSELDLPVGNLEFGQNKKSTPVFFVFDVSPEGDGTLSSNIREVRHKGAPSMTWGYINGRQHYLGHFKSRGMESANKFPGYTIWMEDRCDVFVEDVTRTALIEEVPQF